MVTRISGIVSGLDVDTLVKQMITAKRLPLDKLTQQKQILQWQRDNYREINSKLVDFKNSKLSKYDKSSELNTQTAVVSGNITALKAEATADANGIPMKVDIISLAKPISWETTGIKAADEKVAITSKTKLKDLLAPSNVSPKDGSYSLEINGASFEFSEEMSISEVVSKINTNSTANVTATFDEVSGNFSLASKTYGAQGRLVISDIGENSLLSVLGTKTSNKPDGYVSANVSVNGAKLTHIDSNTFTLNGVKLTLLSKTEEISANVNTQSDSTKALETIRNFVKDYNDLLGTLQSKVNEERYKDFTPLTDEQKEAMTDKDIELWETKAKSGLLKNDEILKTATSSLRLEVTKKLSELNSIGITTGQYYENGKLYIDEDKLKQALTDNPQKIMNLFQGATASEGLFDKLTSTVNTTLDKIVTKAGTSKFSADLTIAYKTDSFMGKRLTDYNTRIATLQTRLTTMETNFYKQFTAMETAMNKYNSQSSALSSYFA